MSVRSAAAALLVVLVSGCGGSEVPAEVVAAKAADLLARQVGVRPVIVRPDDVPAEEGATTRCVLTAGGDPTEYGVTVTIVRDEDGSLTVEVQVDDEPVN
ncbi:MAG: DUF4333 domain-containing protein [Blastococcus sp.]